MMLSGNRFSIELCGYMMSRTAKAGCTILEPTFGVGVNHMICPRGNGAGLSNKFHASGACFSLQPRLLGAGYSLLPMIISSSKEQDRPSKPSPLMYNADDLIDELFYEWSAPRVII
ncbi:hypothetical protein CHS0354_022018 [Potamilus streckersoni]|uniref:Uncharacterized protein n=1 Tax=Potamilus streckersoni TaxID=2493646 RepID=A0AAE0T1V0_9BIVA|nr:hypothetical protein CHS0354_022018 [Potamilus streckersoni]